MPNKSREILARQPSFLLFFQQTLLFLGNRPVTHTSLKVRLQKLPSIAAS
jgi:hypothetical protein